MRARGYQSRPGNGGLGRGEATSYDAPVHLQPPLETDELLQNLMRRYQEGDEEAFVQIYRLMAGPIQRYLSRFTDASRVGDLAQETFLQMHRARRTYRSELPFRPWLYAIARHVALQGLRKQGRRS